MGVNKTAANQKGIAEVISPNTCASAAAMDKELHPMHLVILAALIMRIHHKNQKENHNYNCRHVAIAILGK